MARQGYAVELRRYDGQGWRAMFCPEGFERCRPHVESHRGRLYVVEASAPGALLV